MRADLTTEQIRNRARALIALRIVAGLLALGTTANLWNSYRDGYLRLGLSDRRGPGGDFLLLDTRFGVALGRLLLEIVAVYFAIVAVSPRHALRLRILLTSLVGVMLVSGLLHVLFE